MGRRNCAVAPVSDPLRPIGGLTSDEITIKLAEYERAQDMLKHYDLLNWQIGSILIGANAVLAGLVINLMPKVGWWGLLVAPAIALFSFVLLEAWMRWFDRHRTLYNFRNETLHRIEVQLGMYHFLPVAQASLTRPLDPEVAAQLSEARERAYRVGEAGEFVPLYPGLLLGGTSGRTIASFLRYAVPIAELVTLVCVVVALNA